MTRLALHEPPTRILEQHLRASAPLEDGAFYLLREGHGPHDRRLLASELILPPPDAWEEQGEGILRPSARWLSAVVGRAIEANAGLLFVHSHPDANHPASLSPIDTDAMYALGATIGPMLHAPFAGAVVHESGWAGVVWNHGELDSIASIVSVGSGLRVVTPNSSDPDDLLDARQRDALGIVNGRVRSLNVGLVGCGGLGSPIAEQLYRMGVAKLVLIDDDELDTPSNVRRVFGSTFTDLSAAVAPAKVDVVGRHLDSIALGTAVTRIKGDVRTEEVFRALLDTDVVMIGTDTHGSRATVNDLASTYLLPVIDVGVRAGAKRDGTLSGLTAEVRLLTPERPCLWCRNAISADVIHAENLPREQREQLQRDGYLVGAVGEPVPSVISLTALGAGMATATLLALLSDESDVIPSGYVLDGMFGDAFETKPQEPRPDCRCQRHLGRGDAAAPPFIG
jgi:molybdopterin/thiamine biosynthesis adenylyltransferase